MRVISKYRTLRENLTSLIGSVVYDSELVITDKYRTLGENLD
jgi:hypothetical protein